MVNGLMEKTSPPNRSSLSSLLLSPARLDILHQVEMWQRSYKRIVSSCIVWEISSPPQYSVIRGRYYPQ